MNRPSALVWGASRSWRHTIPPPADIDIDEAVAMVWAEEDIAIARPCETVFALVTDVQGMPSWRSTLVNAAWDDEEPAELGRRFRAVTKVAGRRFAWNCEITEWDPPRAFGYIARGTEGNPHEVAAGFDLEPVADGCRLTMAGGGQVPGRIAGMAAPLFVRLIRRENRTALKKLKTLAEQSQPSAT